MVTIYSQLLSRRQIVLFGKDLRTYCVALHQSKNFSSEGSGDKRHPHAIILLDEQPDGKYNSKITRISPN